MTRNVVSQALLVFVGSLLVLATVFVAPAHAAPTAVIERDGEPITVTLNGRTAVASGDVVDAVWVANGRATVDGRVEGSVIILNGGTTVSGSVGGDVIVVRGDVTIGPDAVVRGDVRASRPITVEEGAVVDGTVRQTSVIGGLQALAGTLRTALWIGLTVALLALGLVAVRLTGDMVDRAGAQLTGRPFGSAVGGLAVLVLLPLLALVTVATIIGGLLGLLLLALTALVALAGLIVTATAIGRWILPDRSSTLAFLLGAVILRAVALVPYVGSLVTIGAAVVGTGALLALWRGRRGAGAATPAVGQPVPGQVGADATGASPTAGAGVNLDLRPGHERAPMFDDRSEEAVGASAMAPPPNWLDDLIGGPAASQPGQVETERAEGDPVVDLRSDPVEAAGAATDGGDGPEVIAALPVREDNFADDPDGPTGNRLRQALFADAPVGGSSPVDGELLVEAAEPAPPGEAATGGYSGPVFTEADPTRVPAPASGSAGPDRLFADAPEDDAEEADLDSGSRFSAGGRAWRATRN